VVFSNKLIFLRWGVVSPTPNPQDGGPPLVGCPRLLIQYIRSYPPYLEGVSSIHNLRTRHAVVTRNPPDMEKLAVSIFYPENGNSGANNTASCLRLSKCERWVKLWSAPNFMSWGTKGFSLDVTPDFSSRAACFHGRQPSSVHARAIKRWHLLFIKLIYFGWHLALQIQNLSSLFIWPKTEDGSHFMPPVLQQVSSGQLTSHCSAKHK
jgi:hypothetical protein